MNDLRLRRIRRYFVGTGRNRQPATSSYLCCWYIFRCSAKHNGPSLCLWKERIAVDSIIVIHENCAGKRIDGRLRSKQYVSARSLSNVFIGIWIYSVGLSHENPGSLYSNRDKYLFVFSWSAESTDSGYMLPCVPHALTLYTTTTRVYRSLVYCWWRLLHFFIFIYIKYVLTINQTHPERAWKRRYVLRWWPSILRVSCGCSIYVSPALHSGLWHTRECARCLTVAINDKCLYASVHIVGSDGSWVCGRSM